VDLASTFGLFFAILSGVGLISAALNNVLGHDPRPAPAVPAGPSGAGLPAGAPRANALRSGVTLGVLVVALGVQYFAAPATSLFTYPFFHGVPFPGSTLKACHVTVADLPTGITGQAQPNFNESLAGATLHISGSSVLYDLVATAGREFDLTNNTLTTVDKLDSGQGLQNVVAGRSQIGLSDIYVQDDPDPTVSATTGLLDYHVAVAPFTLMVSSDLKDTVWNLTTQQIVAIFSGKIANWRSIGGPDEPITVFNRKVGSGTRVNFEKYVLGISLPIDDLRAPTTQTLIHLMGRTPGAIGYAATTSIVQGSGGLVYPICIDGYGATMAAINGGNYTYWSYEHAYVKTTSPVEQAFMDYVCGDDFQAQDVVGKGFLQIARLRGEAIATHAEDFPQPQRCGGA
jgi:phosphate transport system substrate-binding protein